MVNKGAERIIQAPLFIELQVNFTIITSVIIVWILPFYFLTYSKKILIIRVLNQIWIISDSANS